jgi:hypothetical protein
LGYFQLQILGQELAYEDRPIEKTRRNHALAEGRREVPRAGDDAYRMIFGHIGICAARRDRWNGLLDVHQTKRSVLDKAFVWD